MSETVYLVDDSVSILRGLKRLLLARGYRVVAHLSAREFFEILPRDPIGCVVLDLDMPEIGGLEAQRHLGERAGNLPIVFLTGRGSIATCAEALKRGAVDFLEKPVDEQRLCDAIERALERNREARRATATRSSARELIERLTEREREILRLVVRGLSSPEVAELLGIAAGTVKLHRKRMMAKLETDNIAELVMLCQQAELD